MSIALLMVYLFSSIPAFATVSSVTSLDREITKTNQSLDSIGNRVESQLDQLDSQTKDPLESARIVEKQAEIQELIEGAQESLESVKNKAELSQIVSETKNQIELKVEAATTPVVDVTELISPTLAPNSQALTQATETLLDSFSSSAGYMILLRTRKSYSEVTSILQKYDTQFTLELLFDVAGVMQYQLTLPDGSLIQRELFEHIDNGEIPKDLFGIEVIRPELFSLSSDITGESSEKLWGMSRYGIENWSDTISVQSQKLGKRISIGIIDTGILGAHSDIAGKISTNISGYDFVNDDTDPMDDQGHGTHVAGTIAGAINGGGVYGVNPNVELVGLKICDAKGFCPSYAVLSALKYALDHHIDILNMSLGAKGNPITSPICQGIREVTENGTIVVAAAGNSNVDASTFIPGGCANAITVAAVDPSLSRAGFSNYGAKVDVSAPGVGIYSSYLGGGYKSMNGTSMATPHVVGIVSIIQSYRPSITSNEVKKLLASFAIAVGTDGIKPIASFTDVPALMEYLVGEGEGDTRNTDEISIESTSLTSQTTQEPLPRASEKATIAPENIARIDASIGLVIQDKKSGVEINSLAEGKILPGSDSDAVLINSSKEPQTSSQAKWEGQGEAIMLSSESEGVKINSTDAEGVMFFSGESIDWNTVDITTGKNLIESHKGVNINTTDSEPEEIIIDPEYAAPAMEGVQINTDEEEVLVDIPVIDDVTAQSQKIPKKGGDDDGVEINNSYYCTVYIGGSCGYVLPNAGGYIYKTSIAGGVQLSIGSNRFTVYGRQPGTSKVYIYSRGYIVHEVTVTVESPPRSLRASVGTYSLQTGYSTWLSITDGNGGYSVTSSNPSVIWVNGAGTNWTLTAKSAGTAIVTYRDQRGYYGTFSMTVTNPIRSIQASLSAGSIEMGKTANITITDGNGGYVAVSSNTSVATVNAPSNSYSTHQNTTFTITGKSAGTTRVTVRDRQGQYFYFDIIVVAPMRVLTYTFWMTTLDIGQSSRLAITDGNGGYSVTSSNPSILSVSGGGTEWSLLAKTPGSVTITIHDQRGWYGQLTYTVRSPLRQVYGVVNNTTPYIGESAIFTITDGNGGYSVTSSNPSVIAVTRANMSTDTVWTLTAKSIGESIITVRDARGSSGWIKITSRARDLSLDVTSLSVEQGSDAYFRIVSGNGGYVHTMSNGNVGWYFDNPSIPSYHVRGLLLGTTILQITDQFGKVGQVTVTVRPKQPTTTLTNLQFSPSVRDETMGGIYFEVEGNYREVGLEYHYGDRFLTSVEKLIPQDDHAYAAMYSLECANKTTCKVHIKPYVIDANGKKIYHRNYDGTNYISVGYDLSGSNIASAETEGVEINGVKEDTKVIFQQIGFSIKKVIESTRGIYDGSYAAVNDQLTELKALLDQQTYQQFSRELKQLVTKIVNGNYDTQAYITKLKQNFSELSTVLDSAYSYFGQLTSYDKQYYGSYLSVSSASTFIGPGKLKGTKALANIEKKAVEVMQKGRAIVLAKKIKSIDTHVFTKHSYESLDPNASKFLQGANIEAVVREGYGKNTKRFVETISGTQPSIKVEVDMGRTIGVANKETSKLRIIVDYNGNVISSYPIDNFSF